MTNVLLQFSHSDVRVIEGQVKEQALRTVKSGKLWPAFKNYPIEVHILRGIAFSVRVDSGPTVHLYITGINFYGGDYGILDKEFWNAMKRALEVVPRMYAETSLVAYSSVATVTLKEVKDNIKRWKVSKGFQPGLWVDPKMVEETKIEGKATFTDKVSKLSVTVPFNKSNYSTIHKTAVIQLSELWLEKNQDTVEESGEAEGPYFYPPGI